MSNKQIHIFYLVIIALLIVIFFIVKNRSDKSATERDYKIMESELKIKMLTDRVNFRDSIIKISDINIKKLKEDINNSEVTYKYIPVKYDEKRNIVRNFSDSASVVFLSKRLNGK